MIGQVTRRWRSTHVPVHSGSPDGRGCNTAPEVWAEEAGTDRSLCPSSVQALCMNLAPTLLHTKMCISTLMPGLGASQLKGYLCQMFMKRGNNLCLPFLMTIFIILMAPPLAWARNSFSSDVAKVTRYKADKSKLKMEGLTAKLGK